MLAWHGVTGLASIPGRHAILGTLRLCPALREKLDVTAGGRAPEVCPESPALSFPFPWRRARPADLCLGREHLVLPHRPAEGCARRSGSIPSARYCRSNSRTIPGGLAEESCPPAAPRRSGKTFPGAH